MGTKERRQRQFDEREAWFLEVAGRLIEEGGLLPLQMNRIAEAAEYAVGTLYQHFASKEDLLLALTTVGMREHVEMFQRVHAWDASSRDRMTAIGVADMIFVRRNPQYFRIAQYVFCEVVWASASAQRRRAFIEANQPIFDIVTSIVQDGVEAGDLDLRDLTHSEFTSGLWALAVGTHNLVHAEGVLADFNVAQPYALMCRHMQAMLDGYGWRPLSSAVADPATLDRLIERITREVFHDFCETDHA